MNISITGRSTRLLVMCFYLAHEVTRIEAQDFSIAGIVFQAPSSLDVTYLSKQKHYYVLEQAKSLQLEAFRPTALQNGTGEPAKFVVASDNSASIFFRIREVPDSHPLDTDQDGIDDVYELRQEGVLNPLLSEDASQAMLLSGETALQIYQTADQVRYVNSRRAPAITVIPNDDAATQAITLASITQRTPIVSRYISMNDAKKVAFMGTVSTPAGLAHNLYTFDLQVPGRLNVLLNASEPFELPFRQDGASPSQAFSAPMINNNNNVTARRRMNATVQVGFPFGQIITAPLTYLELWPYGGRDTPGAIGMPIATVAMGNAGAGPAAGLLFWLNPVSAGLLPSAFNASSPWDSIHGDENDTLPAQNNSGLVAFCAYKLKDDKHYLTTSLSTGPANSFALPSGTLAHPRVADSGHIVATISTGGGRVLRLFNNPRNLNSSTILADSGAGFTTIGLRPCINPSGTAVLFHANYQGSSRALGKGPGLFAIIGAPSLASGSRTTIRLMGVSRNGIIDPGETFDDKNANFVVDPGEDSGPITRFDTDSYIGVTDSGYVVCKGRDSDGGLALFGTKFSLILPYAVAPASIVSGTGASDLEFYDGLANDGNLVFWADGMISNPTKKAVPSPPIRQAKLLAPEISLKPVSGADPNDYGVVVLKGEKLTVRFDGSKPEDFPFKTDQLSWEIRRAKQDGTFDGWTTIPGGMRGHTVSFNAEQSGIFQLRAILRDLGSDNVFNFVHLRESPQAPWVKVGVTPDAFGVVSSDAQLRARVVASRYLGWTLYSVASGYPNDCWKGVNKCNYFIFDSLREARLPIARSSKSFRSAKYYEAKDWYYGTDCSEQSAAYLAEDWIKGRVPGWERVLDNASPEPGWIVARPALASRSGATGHCGVLDYDGAWINAGKYTVNRNARLDESYYQPVTLNKLKAE